MSNRIVVFLMMLCAGCGVVSADTINAYTVDGSMGENIWLYMPSGGANGPMAVQQTYFTGVIDIVLGANRQKYYRNTLCVDLFTDILIGKTYFTNVEAPEFAEKEFPKYGNSLTETAWLIDTELPVVEAAVGNPTADHGGSAAMGAGLQLAIWKLTVDGSGDFSSGLVQVVTAGTAGANSTNLTDPNAVYWADLYEAAALTTPPQFSNDAFVYVNSSGGQYAQMLEGPEYGSGPQPTTPEPSTFVLLGGGLVAASLVLRKKVGQRSRKADPAS